MRIGGSPSAEEAAGIAAAIEMLMGELMPAEDAPERLDPWRQTALLEGVGRAERSDLSEPWIKT